MAPGDSAVFLNAIKRTSQLPLVEIVEFDDSRVKPLIHVVSKLAPYCCAATLSSVATLPFLTLST